MSAEIKKMIQELIVPGLTEIKLDQKNIHTKIDSLHSGLKSEVRRLDEKIDYFRNEVKAEVGSVKAEVGSLRNEMDAFRNEMRSEIRRIDDKIDIALDVRERLAVLESKAAIPGR